MPAPLIHLNEASTVRREHKNAYRDAVAVVSKFRNSDRRRVLHASTKASPLAEIPSLQIVTLTINPAVDVSTSVKKMVPFTKMRCAQPHRDPGGGGINVARVLKRLGAEATAIYPIGGATGQSLAALVEGEGVRSRVIPV